MGRIDGTEGALLIIGEITTNALLHTPHPGRRGVFVVWCSSVRIACGCPSAVLVSSRPAHRTCVPHNPPLTVKVGGVLSQGLRDASAPVRRELSQGLSDPPRM